MPKYVVTLGYRRQLVVAGTQREARELFRFGATVNGARLKVADHEMTVREATDDDIREFYPRRGTHQLRKENESLFDVDEVAPKVKRERPRD
jgi:hypothetical protein